MKKTNLELFDAQMENLVEGVFTLSKGQCQRILDSISKESGSVHPALMFSVNHGELSTAALGALIKTIQKHPLVRQSVKLAHPKEMEFLSHLADPIVWLRWGLTAYSDQAGEVDWDYLTLRSGALAVEQPEVKTGKVRQASYLIGVICSALHRNDPWVLKKYKTFGALAQKKAQEEILQKKPHVLKIGSLVHWNKRKAQLTLAGVTVGSLTVGSVSSLLGSNMVAGSVLSLAAMGVGSLGLWGLMENSSLMPWSQRALRTIGSLFDFLAPLTKEQKKHLNRLSNSFGKIKTEEVLHMICHRWDPAFSRPEEKEKVLDYFRRIPLVPDTEEEIVLQIKDFLKENGQIITYSSFFLEQMLESMPANVASSLVGEQESKAFDYLCNAMEKRMLSSFNPKCLAYLQSAEELAALEDIIAPLGNTVKRKSL